MKEFSNKMKMNNGQLSAKAAKNQTERMHCSQQSAGVML